MTPAATPPTAPSRRPALPFADADGLAADAPAVVEEGGADELAAAEEVAAAALTVLAVSVPQVVHDWEPGFS